MAKILLSPSTENKPVKKQVFFPQSLGRRLHWFVQRPVSNLLIRYNYCATVCFSCIKPARVSLGLTSPLQQRDRCLQMPCTRLCRRGTKSSPKCWTLPGKLSVACKKLRGKYGKALQEWLHRCLIIQEILACPWGHNCLTRLHWENSLTIKTAEKNRKGEPYAQGLNTFNLLHPIIYLSELYQHLCNTVKGLGSIQLLFYLTGKRTFSEASLPLRFFFSIVP